MTVLGTANSTTVKYGGSLCVWSYGTTNCTTVDNGGYLAVYRRGTANSTTLNGGSMFVSSGGTMTGRMTFENGATVSAFEGAVLNFDLTRMEAGAAALENDVSLIQGTPLYTLTVSGTELDGTYSLAGGAAGFAGAISVYSGGESFGSFSVGRQSPSRTGTTR